ncbi:MAG TPA: cell division protein FtsA [Candidatus Saccharimonadales bacterium]|nr:cell division protein FtsA [Candidatus Saccharimonadales bacterium]
MRDSASQTYVGLDVGSSTVRCVVGMIDPNTSNKISILGHGSAPNVGMRKGVVVHIDDAAEAIVQAVTEAERLSGMRINTATVNVNGAHVSGINSKGVIAISTANREITPEDRYRVEEAATIVKLPSNREIIQVFAKNYRLDGQDNIKDPVGMHGVRLEVDTHIVSAATPNLRNLDMALEKAQVAPNNHTLSSLAAAEAVLSRQQKEAGTVLVDIGSGTTNIVVIEDGEVQHVAVLPIGGSHITNDLAIGLKTDLDIAEAVKVKHASLTTAGKTPNVRVKVNAQDHIFKAEEIAMITEARVDELFEYVNKELTRIHKAHKLPGGVVLVGGTSKLPGIAEFAKEKMQLPARVGKLQSVSGLVDTVADPSYAAGVGLMMLDMLLAPQDQSVMHGNTSSRALNFVDSLWSKIKK